MKAFVVAAAVLFALTATVQAKSRTPVPSFDEEEENAPYTVPNLTASWADWNRTCRQGGDPAAGISAAKACENRASLEADLRAKGLCLNGEMNFVKCKPQKVAVKPVVPEPDPKSPASAAPMLIQTWNIANNRCRGGSTEADLLACNTRETLTANLYEIGWCYGKRGEAGYQNKWHRCTATSYHP